MTLENYIVILFTTVFYLYLIYYPVPTVIQIKHENRQKTVMKRQVKLNQSTIDIINSTLKKNGLNIDKETLFYKETP